jgi:hypothetical protein
VSLGGSAIPLLELFEPGFWMRVGVSKPVGASLGGGGAARAARVVCRPIKEIRTTADLLIMTSASVEIYVVRASREN